MTDGKRPAVGRLDTMDIKPSDARGAVPAATGANLLRALQAQRIALDAQHRELRRTRLDLAAALDRYRNLYDQAPVGYLTLDGQGCILDANDSTARLLGHPRASLARRPLSAFMPQADADRWQVRWRHAFREAAAWRIELRFLRRDGVGFTGQLDGLQLARSDELATLLVTLADVTGHRHAAADRRAALQVMAGQEAERHRVARELHDDLGQRLSALKMTLVANAARGLPDADICRALDVLDEAVASVRRMASELRPLMLDDLGLGAAVEALARHAARQYRLQLTLRLDANDPPPGDPTSVTLYRLLQAGLPLLASQPGLGCLSVELREAAGSRLLTVQGQRRPATPGEAPAIEPARWTVLRETAHLMGCALDVASTRHGGERITLGMPLRSTDATLEVDTSPPSC